MPIVNTGRFDLNYVEAGSGFPVVLIHGLAGDHTAWLPQIDAFKSKWRVIAFDNPGSGASSKVDAPVTTAELGAAALGLMDRLGIAQAHIVGRSMGGAIAQHVALAQPARVRSLAFAASFGRMDALGRRMIENMETLLAWRKNWADWAPFAVPLFVSPDFYNDNPALVERVTKMISDPARDMVSYSHLAQACLNHDTLDRLHEIMAPTLVMSGRYDPICANLSQTWLLERLPNTTFVPFEHSSHYFMVEEAAKALDTLTGWLTKNTP